MVAAPVPVVSNKTVAADAGDPAADDDGSKKEETLRCPTEAPEETRKSECCPLLRFLTSSRTTRRIS